MYALPTTTPLHAVRSQVLLVAAVVAASSVWFSTAAVLAPLAAEAGRPAGALAGLTTAVQLGFVLGALTVAASGIADRVDPRLVLALAASLAGVCNLALLVLAPDGAPAWLSRAAMGVALAGVYPVGLKIAVGWSPGRRGLLVGALVGAMTLGAAMPHLAALLGGADWRWVVVATTLLAVLGAGLVLAVELGPHHRPSPAFRPCAVLVVLRDPPLRRAVLGYLGHMWELYAFWAWLAVVAGTAAAAAGHGDGRMAGAAVAFVAVASGGLACAPAGHLADRYGKARVARLAMVASAACGLLAALVFAGPFWLFAILLVLWGLTIVVDSGPLSALVADRAGCEIAGSVLAAQTGVGFALTAVTIEAVPHLVALAGWPSAFAVLALGPIFGAWVLDSGSGPKRVDRTASGPGVGRIVGDEDGR